MRVENLTQAFEWYHFQSSSSRMRVMNHNWSATKQRLHRQSVAEISRHSVLSVATKPRRNFIYFVRLSVRYKTCQRDILKTNAPILLQIGTSDPRGRGVKWGHFGVTRAKVNIAQGGLKLALEAWRRYHFDRLPAVSLSVGRVIT